jgi:hypothetical protein
MTTNLKTERVLIEVLIDHPPKKSLCRQRKLNSHSMKNTMLSHEFSFFMKKKSLGELDFEGSPGSEQISRLKECL